MSTSGPSTRISLTKQGSEATTEGHSRQSGVAATKSGFLAWREIIRALMRDFQPDTVGAVQKALAAEEELIARADDKTALKALLARSGGLQKWASLLNDLLHDTHCPLGAPITAADDEALAPDDRPALLQAMLLALFRFASQSRRLMLLLHLVTGTSRDHDVDVWSWRTANTVARELSKEDEQAAACPLCLPPSPASPLSRARGRWSCAS